MFGGEVVLVAGVPAGVGLVVVPVAELGVAVPVPAAGGVAVVPTHGVAGVLALAVVLVPLAEPFAVPLVFAVVLLGEVVPVVVAGPVVGLDVPATPAQGLAELVPAVPVLPAIPV